MNDRNGEELHTREEPHTRFVRDTRLPTFGQWVEHVAMMIGICWAFDLAVLSRFPSSVKLAIVLWSCWGAVAVVVPAIRGSTGASVTLAVQTWKDGLRYLLMVLFWPVLWSARRRAA